MNRRPEHVFRLAAAAPFRLDLTAWILRRREDNQVDRWDGESYRRALAVDGEPVNVAVAQEGPPGAPRLRVTLSGRAARPDLEPRVAACLERGFGLRADLSGFYGFAGGYPELRRLIEPFRGAKPPRYLSSFEALVNAVACQQITLTLGVRMLNRLARAYGLADQAEEDSIHAFPRPEDLAGAAVDDLRGLGFSAQKSQTILTLARSIAGGQLDLGRLESLPDAAAVEQLTQIKGIGRWTAEYFLLRGLGRVHVFPGDDVGARNNLQAWLGLDDRLDYAAVRTALGDWWEYGGLIYFHLLLRSLASKGLIEGLPLGERDDQNQAGV